jgi:hypothetical protein
MVIRKGCNALIDSYLGFKEADHETSTGLAIKVIGHDTIYVLGDSWPAFLLLPLRQGRDME